MTYQFPENLTLQEVFAVIDGHNEHLGTKAFIAADKGTHVIFNYLVAFEGSFPEPNTGDAAEDRRRAILRECRGLIMCKTTGAVLARRFQKFFNVLEKPETQFDAINWSKPHVILEKLDGSMITPFMDGDVLRWGTKMGATDVAAPVEDFVKYNHRLKMFVHILVDADMTPIFEWCSRKQKIVIDYPEDRLVLTAIRHNQTGKYCSYEYMCRFAEPYFVDVVRALPGTAENIQAFMAEAKSIEGAEGYVIRFEDGHMVKVKGEWYVAIHKTKDMIQNEKSVWELILNDRVDDAKAFMDAADRERVSRFHDEFERRVMATAEGLGTIVNRAKIEVEGNKKRFATEIIPHSASAVRPMMFSIWDGHDPVSVVTDHLRKFIGSGPRIEQVRHLVGGLRWEDYRDTSFVSDN